MALPKSHNNNNNICIYVYIYMCKYVYISERYPIGCLYTIKKRLSAMRHSTYLPMKRDFLFPMN